MSEPREITYEYGQANQDGEIVAVDPADVPLLLEYGIGLHRREIRPWEQVPRARNVSLIVRRRADEETDRYQVRVFDDLRRIFPGVTSIERSIAQKLCDEIFLADPHMRFSPCMPPTTDRKSVV